MAEKLAVVGPTRFYEPGYFSDYPPGFLYVLWLIGSLVHGDLFRFAVKAISIPADVGIVLLLAPLRRRHAGERAAVLAAGVWMLQPASQERDRRFRHGTGSTRSRHRAAVPEGYSEFRSAMSSRWRPSG